VAGELIEAPESTCSRKDMKRGKLPNSSLINIAGPWWVFEGGISKGRIGRRFVKEVDDNGYRIRSRDYNGHSAISEWCFLNLRI
jgi:hypothetical protein